MKLTKLKVNTNGEPVHWTSGKGYSSNDIVQWLQYRKAKPGKIFYRTNCDETKPFSEILVRRKTRKQALPKLVPAYTHKLPISSKKLDDLLKLCEDHAIPERYHYYESLAAGGADDEPTSDEDKDDDMQPEEQQLAYIFSISFNTDRTLYLLIFISEDVVKEERFYANAITFSWKSVDNQMKVPIRYWLQF